MENEKILEVLDENFKTTTEIAKQVRMHWYYVYACLVELLTQGKVERIQLKRMHLWRKKI